MKKQILIEKYIEPSEVENRSDRTIIKLWLNRNYDLHSFMGHPAVIRYYSSGQIIGQTWFKKDIIHRDGDLPAYIGYDSNGKISCQEWYKKGVYHRDGDLPAYIGYNSNGQINYQHWY